MNEASSHKSSSMPIYQPDYRNFGPELQCSYVDIVNILNIVYYFIKIRLYAFMKDANHNIILSLKYLKRKN